jgi:hypothetical protein
MSLHLSHLFTTAKSPGRCFFMHAKIPFQTVECTAFIMYIVGDNCIAGVLIVLSCDFEFVLSCEFDFLWAHAIFRYWPNLNPSNDQHNIL